MTKQIFFVTLLNHKIFLKISYIIRVKSTIIQMDKENFSNIIFYIYYIILYYIMKNYFLTMYIIFVFFLH